jgi:serine/threonine-protein kinase
MTTELIGKMLGQYEIVELVGEGGLAAVYKAFQPSLQRWVAIKVLHEGYEETLARFRREAEAIARLRHRNILVIYEYGEEQGYPYIVMELVEQGTLKDYLTDKPMDWVRTVRLIIPIAEALHYAHQQGLIHRDVKPSNILIPQEDWPLLGDFGLVKVSDAEQALTATGIIMGTPAFMAPEQASGVVIDHRADMYAIGVILFRMITGRLPFDYENPHLLMMAHLSEPPPSPRQFNPTCPPELESIILTALRKEPDERYPDMQTMVNALKYVLNVSTVAMPSTTLTSSETPDRPSGTMELAIDHNQARAKSARILLSAQNVSIDLPEPPESGLVIGRSHQSIQVDIDLGPYDAAGAGVSRQHARLVRQGADWLIEDLGSLNGTYVNNIKLTPHTPHPLKKGDTVRCSRMSFVFS